MSRILFLDHEALLEIPGITQKLTEQNAEVVTLSGYLRQNAMSLKDVPVVLRMLFHEKFDVIIVSGKHDVLNHIFPEDRDKVIVVLEENPTVAVQVGLVRIGYRHILSKRNVIRHLSVNGAVLPE